MGRFAAPCFTEEITVDRRDFFQKLFGDEPRGVICIRGISRTKPVENIFVETYEEADAAIAHFEEEDRNVYFTTGALKDSTSATVEIGRAHV